jgi:hypothetical protein
MQQTLVPDQPVQPAGAFAEPVAAEPLAPTSGKKKAGQRRRKRAKKRADEAALEAEPNIPAEAETAASAGRVTAER